MSIISELAVEKKQVSLSYNFSIEMTRLLACFGVISIHVHADTVSANNFSVTFNLFCVPFFFITGLIFFIHNVNSKIEVSSILDKMWKRIGIPFIAWSTIYTSLILIKSLLIASFKPFTIYTFGRIYLYGESAEQLYFLPELAIMQILGLSIFLIVHNVKSIIGLGLFGIAVCYLMWGFTHNYYGITPVKSIIAYILAAFFLSPKVKRISNNGHYLIAGVLLIFLSISGAYFNNDKFLETHLFSLPLGGIGLLLIILYSPQIVLPKWVLLLTSTTYGVYLCHVVFLELTEFLIEKLHYKIFYDLSAKFLMTLFVFVISLLFILTIKKVRIFRVILLGER